MYSWLASDNTTPIPPLRVLRPGSAAGTASRARMPRKLSKHTPSPSHTSSVACMSASTSREALDQEPPEAGRPARESCTRTLRQRLRVSKATVRRIVVPGPCRSVLTCFLSETATAYLRTRQESHGITPGTKNNGLDIAGQVDAGKVPVSSRYPVDGA